MASLLIEGVNLSEWIREQLLTNGELHIQQVIEFAKAENTYETRNLVRALIGARAVKGMIERDYDKILSCKDGLYFLVEKSEDCDIEMQKRKNRGMGYLETFRRILPHVLDNFPSLAPNIIKFSGELMRKALDVQLNPDTKKLKEKNENN